MSDARFSAKQMKLFVHSCKNDTSHIFNENEILIHTYTSNVVLYYIYIEISIL